MREIVRTAVTGILEVAMSDALGTDRGGRTEGLLGHHPKDLVTRVGNLELRAPRDRDGRFSTQLFERHSRSEKTLVAALAEVYAQGVSPREGTDRLPTTAPWWSPRVSPTA